MNGTLPFPAYEKRQGVILAMKVAVEGLRPTFTEKALESWPPPIRKLMQECWTEDFRKRPNFSVIISQLENVINQQGRNQERTAATNTDADIIGIPVL